LILLSCLFKCWDYRHIPPRTATTVGLKPFFTLAIVKFSEAPNVTYISEVWIFLGMEKPVPRTWRKWLMLKTKFKNDKSVSKFLPFLFLKERDQSMEGQSRGLWNYILSRKKYSYIILSSFVRLFPWNLSGVPFTLTHAHTHTNGHAHTGVRSPITPGLAVPQKAQ
jgi:hypothetical protein